MRKALALSAICVFILSATAGWAAFPTHYGNANPVDEGWSLYGDPGYASTPLKTGLWDLSELRNPPNYSLAGSTVEDGIRVDTLYYSGESYKGKPTRVFAYYAQPEGSHGRYPAMILVHGGGGNAFPEWVRLWAKRGYAALAISHFGKGPDDQPLPDAGPDEKSANTFLFDDPKDSWNYQATADIIRGVSLLSAMPDVDPKRIGITGISMGGYLTCLVAGLDNRLKVAVPVYGCGYIYEDSGWSGFFQDRMTPAQRDFWVGNFDPSTFLGQCMMPMLFVTGTNDFFYPLGSVQKTYRLVKKRTLCITVNMPHGHQAGWSPPEIGIFVDSVLLLGTPLAAIISSRHSGHSVELELESKSPISSAQINYTTDTGPWKDRKWETQIASIDGERVYATLPDIRPVTYFFLVTDARGAKVSSEHECLTAGQ